MKRTTLVCLALVAASCGRMAPPGAAASASNVGPTSDRRVVRTAELWLQVERVDESRKSLAALVESAGGHLVSLQQTRFRDDDGAENARVDAVVRIPAARFEATLEAIRGLARRVSRETGNGQDVTEEYVDLQARARALRAVEDQYLDILKQAKSIRDTLEVQEKLGAVRVDIERAEGRRLYLEHESDLATATLHLDGHLDALEATGTGLGASVAAAAHDARVIAVAVVTFAIRAAGVLSPLALFLGAPLALAWRGWRRRRARQAHATSGAN